MIQRVSELDRYSVEQFRTDYLDLNEKKDGKDNPNYGKFKTTDHYSNLSDTMLFEISLGRPMLSSNGALNDSVQNEAISYYKSYKAGGDVLGEIAWAIVNNYFSNPSEPISFGTPGSATNCLDHQKYPNNESNPLEVYCPSKFHSETTFHSKAYFHDGLSASNNCTINFPGLTNNGSSWTFTNDINGTCLRARWADLAECYKSDADYPVGTLVQFGGDEEITIAGSEANAVITEKPGFILNSSDDGKMLGIALTGRTPVRVIGPVRKFDKLCFSGIPGVACSRQPGMDGSTIAVALEGNDVTEEKLVLCAVQLSL